MIPWRTIRSWRCYGCGRCCKGFRVDLSLYEYARITMYWPDAIKLGRWGSPCLGRRNGNCYFLNDHGSCYLQPIGMKPFACKIWPFAVYSNNKRYGEGDAYFRHRDEGYYVYLPQNSSICPGINRGDPAELPLIISEIVELYKNPFKEQVYSTCNYPLAHERRSSLITPPSVS